MLKYLVTGGCGFIGSHVTERLLQEGYQVRILDNLANSSKCSVPSEAELIVGSITDDRTLKRAVKGIDGLFHLAALISVTDSIKHWYHNHQVNCAAMIRLAELSGGLPILFASSAAVYGDTNQLPQHESMAPCPLSPYAVDKLACELHLKLAWELHRTPSVSFRFFNIYGPGQNPKSPYSGVISKFVDLLKNKQSITIYGDGKQSRDFVYVKDVAKILVKTMSNQLKGATVYNLCTGHAISINELADIIGEIAGIAIKKEYAIARPGEILSSCGDPTKLVQAFGMQASTTLKQGLINLMP